MRLLKQGWKAACDYKQLQRKLAFRKVRTLQADTKTDPEVLDEAQRKRDDLDQACALANVKYYTFVSLDHVLDENPMPSAAEVEAELDAKAAAEKEEELRKAAEEKAKAAE